MSRRTYSIEDIENKEDLFFKTDELSGSDCYWTDSDSNECESEKEVEGNVEQSCSSQSVETTPMLTPQIEQSLFASRPAAVNITGRFCRSDSDKEDDINEQPCSSRSIRKLHKAPPKRKNSRSANARPIGTPHNKRKRRSNTSDSRPTSNTSTPQQSTGNASDLSSMWEYFPAPVDNALTPMDTWLPTFASNIGFFSLLKICLLLHQLNFFIFFLMMSFGIL